MDDHDERIKKRAHEIWEEEGRPEGREYSHWLRARAEINEEEAVPPPTHSPFILSPDRKPEDDEARSETKDIALNALPPGTVPENPTAENPDRLIKPLKSEMPLNACNIDAPL